jgi:hypothetical protein
MRFLPFPIHRSRVRWQEEEGAAEEIARSVGQIDKAMDDFFKPIMKQKSPDTAKVKTAYDGFIAKLQGAVTKQV